MVKATCLQKSVLSLYFRTQLVTDIPVWPKISYKNRKFQKFALLCLFVPIIPPLEVAIIPPPKKVVIIPPSDFLALTNVAIKLLNRKLES
jgi:hypothetical protein